MLLSLKIANYALIDALHVEFHKGLNIITGETGAGKSILLGALGLILGKRADTGVLSNTEKKCVVEAEFGVKGYQLAPYFEELDADYDDHTVFRREILPSGKSRAFINDSPVTLSVLQSLALHLVDIHSQHQNLLLNQQEFLLNIVDRYCNNAPLNAKYQQAYKKYKHAEQLYVNAKENFDTIQSDIDYLSHQVHELTEAKLQAGEVEELEQQLKQLENAGDIKTALHAAINMLSGDEAGTLDALRMVESGLQKVEKYYPKASEFAQRIENARIELKELDVDIQNSFETLDFDPDQQQVLQNRLDLLNGLLLKHRLVTIEELIVKRDELNEKLSVGVDGGFNLDKQLKELQKLEADAIALAKKLSAARTSAFPKIEGSVIAMLQDLGIEHGTLKIEAVKQELLPTGIDKLSFLFSANKNHPLKDVSKIASGGELSRLMLSVKALLTSSVGMPTIILDEIDTGVSGDIADKVGNIIRYMGQGMQVINITHLPQVASKAEAHFKVFKDHSKEFTQTQIKQLDDTERLEEIAKMLSGEELTDAAIENARALLKN